MKFIATHKSIKITVEAPTRYHARIIAGKQMKVKNLYKIKITNTNTNV